MEIKPGHTIDLPDPEATREAALSVAEMLSAGSVVALTGQLGAGKTTFVKAVAESLGVTEEVTSPSFIRLNIYKGDLPVYHLDLYRVEDRIEFLALGFDEYLDTEGVTLIEWAERAAGVLPGDTLTVALEYSDDGLSRKMTLSEGFKQP
jgi:tRNA threonylcarbamoyladenosine biosynthesis protein TsaE